MIDGFLVIDKPAGLTSHDVVQRVRRLGQAAPRRPPGHARSARDRRAADRARRGDQALAAPDPRREELPRQSCSSASRPRPTTARARWSRARDGPVADPRRAREGAVRVRGRDRAGAAAVLGGEARAARPPTAARAAARKSGSSRAASRSAASSSSPTSRRSSRSRSTAAPAPTCARWPTTSGAALGTGAHLWELCRTRSGPFQLAQAITLDALDALGARGADRVIPMLAATGLPTFEIDARVARRVRNGVQLGRQEMKGAPTEGVAPARPRGASGGAGRGAAGHSRAAHAARLPSRRRGRRRINPGRIAVLRGRSAIHAPEIRR